MSANLKASNSSEKGSEQNVVGDSSQNTCMVPGAGFEPATSGLGYWRPCSPDYESGAHSRLGYPGYYFDTPIHFHRRFLKNIKSSL